MTEYEDWWHDQRDYEEWLAWQAHLKYLEHLPPDVPPRRGPRFPKWVVVGTAVLLLPLCFVAVRVGAAPSEPISLARSAPVHDRYNPCIRDYDLACVLGVAEYMRRWESLNTRQPNPLLTYELEYLPPIVQLALDTCIEGTRMAFRTLRADGSVHGGDVIDGVPNDVGFNLTALEPNHEIHLEAGKAWNRGDCNVMRDALRPLYGDKIPANPASAVTTTTSRWDAMPDVVRAVVGSCKEGRALYAPQLASRSGVHVEAAKALERGDCQGVFDALRPLYGADRIPLDAPPTVTVITAPRTTMVGQRPSSCAGEGC